MIYDIIGDIHGHLTPLLDLLRILGYTYNGKYYEHLNPNRKALFLGDYIDRGPNIRGVLHLVKGMVDNGQAIAIMGNHEWNAIMMNTRDEHGRTLREESERNIGQHYQTIVQLSGSPGEYISWIEWMKTLPLFFEDENFRAVHACWDNGHIDHLKTVLTENNCIIDKYLHTLNQDIYLKDVFEQTLKGKEMPLPHGLNFQDADGNFWTNIRVKWWVNPAVISYKDFSVKEIPGLPNKKVPHYLHDNIHYNDDKPVFFGHYWMRGEPEIISDTVCCLDWSIAKNGNLATYCYRGEKKLSKRTIKYV